MKKIRRVMSLILVTVMLITIYPISAAASLQNETRARQLYELDLFKGRSETTYLPELEGLSNREEAMTMLYNIFKWELKKPEQCIFADVSDWAKPYVATAYSEGVTLGIGEVNGVLMFGGKDKITKRQIISWIIRELGYADPYYNLALAQEVGLITATELEELNKEISDRTEKQLNRDELVGFFYKTLTLCPNGSKLTVMDSIIAKQPELEAKAISYGLVEPKPTAPTVAAVTVPNYYDVVITFAGDELDNDKLSAIANYEVKGKTISKITVKDKTVTLHLVSPFEKQASAEITIKTGTGIATKYVADIDEVVDSTIPAIASIYAIDNRTVRIEFSEPINNTVMPIILLEKGTIASTPVFDGERYVDVKTFSDLTDQKEYTISVKGVKDMEGYTMKDIETSFVFVKDREPVSISLVGTPTPNLVTIKLDKEIKRVLNVSDFKWFNNSPDSVYRSGETGYTLVFTTTPIAPLGERTITVNKDSLESLWGVKPSQDVEVTFEPYVDTEKPYIVKTNVINQQEMSIEFSEKMLPSTVCNTANYKLYDSAGKLVETEFYVTYNGNEVIAKLIFNENLKVGEYLLKIENLKDTSLIENSIEATEIEITILDTVPPTIAKAKMVIEDKTLFVTFGEKVKVDNLSVNNFKLAGVEPTSVKSTNYENEIMLQFTDKIVAGQTLQVTNVEDISGNKAALITVNNVEILEAAAILKATVIDAKTIEVVLDGDVMSPIYTTDISICDSKGITRKCVSFVEYGEIKNGTTAILVGLDDSISFAKGESPRYISFASKAIKMARGNYVTSEIFLGITNSMK